MKLIGPVLILAILGALALQWYNMSVPKPGVAASSAEAPASETEPEPENICESHAEATAAAYRHAAAKSAGRGDLACSAENWRKAVEKDPLDVSALANLGMMLSMAERHEEALPYYEKAIELAGGAYDMFTWYARSLKATGNYTEAENWYYRALQIEPLLEDATAELATLLVADQNHYKALGLLSGFNTRLDNPYYFKGKILAIESTLSAKEPEARAVFRTVNLARHFFVPIKLAVEGSTYGFMVDTGATLVTFNRDLLAEEKPVFRVVEDDASARIGDGSILSGQRIELNELDIISILSSRGFHWLPRAEI